MGMESVNIFFTDPEHCKAVIAWMIAEGAGEWIRGYRLDYLQLILWRKL
jgi:hypothetical protein